MVHLLGSTIRFGFLSEAFRRHDYQLGRRNCQQFLRKHFVLSERHPLFQGTCPPAALARYAVYRSLDGREVWTYPHQGKEGECYLPIIPLVDDAFENEVPTPTWPRLGLVELEAHREPLRQRLHRLGDRLIEEQQLKLMWRESLELLWKLHYLKVAVDSIMDYVANDLKMRGLLSLDG